MPLENTDVVDIITTSQQGQTVLVITDAGVTTDPEERYALFMEKLKTYVAAIMSGELAKDLPASSSGDYQIRVMCVLPPTEEMLAVQAIKPRGENIDAILVEFEIFSFGDDKPQKVERAPLEAPEISEDLAGAIDFALTMGLEALKEGRESRACRSDRGRGGFDGIVGWIRRHARSGQELCCRSGARSQGVCRLF